MNYLYGRTLFISVVAVSIILSIYINIQYLQLDDEVPLYFLYLILANVTVTLILIVLAVFRCHALGLSGWRVLALIIPIANIILLFILMFRSNDKLSNKSLNLTGAESAPPS